MNASLLLHSSDFSSVNYISTPASTLERSYLQTLALASPPPLRERTSLFVTQLSFVPKPRRGATNTGLSTWEIEKIWMEKAGVFRKEWLQWPITGEKRRPRRKVPTLKLHRDWRSKRCADKYIPKHRCSRLSSFHFRIPQYKLVRSSNPSRFPPQIWRRMHLYQQTPNVRSPRLKPSHLLMPKTLRRNEIMRMITVETYHV